MLKIKLVINPKAGKVRNNFLNINKLIYKLSTEDVLTEVIYTSKDKKDRDMFLHDLSLRDAIIVCGGDGTLNRVITYMIEADVYKPILFMPGGTANIFYLEKKLSSSIPRTVDLLLTGKRVATDIGFVEHDEGINYFLLMVGIGLDAKAVHEADPNVKKLIGKASYLFSGVKNFITYKGKQIEVESDKGLIKDIHSVIISNSRLYGGNIELFPEANMHDGLLDMCVFHPENNVALLRSLVDIQSGWHKISSDVKYKKIKEAYISSSFGAKIPFQLDGESMGYLPISVGILKEKIEFILPND